MEYFVIWNDNHDEFIKSVNKALKDGWELQGGVSVCVNSGNYNMSYHQAIIRK